MTPNAATRALWNACREAELARSGKQPSNEWLNHTVLWWLREGADLKDSDQPDRTLLDHPAATEPASGELREAALEIYKLIETRMLIRNPEHDSALKQIPLQHALTKFKQGLGK